MAYVIHANTFHHPAETPPPPSLIPTTITTIYSTKGRKRVHKFSIFLVTTDNQAKLMFKGKSSGRTDDLQVFSLGDKVSILILVALFISSPR